MNAPHDLAKLAAAGQYTDPAPRPLPDELPPVDPFPLEALPEAFRPWVSDVTERMHCSPDFVGVPMLVGAASLVARHVGIRPQARTDWVERCNLWALSVGSPGKMKSPAMQQALAPLERLEAKAAEEFNTATSQHQVEQLALKLRAEAALKKAREKLKKDSAADVAELLAAQEPDAAPTRRRYIVSDLTYESLGEILSANPDGVLSVRDEMRGLFLSLAREESAPARAFYLQAWSGGTYRFDRIGRGSVTIPDARLSMIGCIQPGPLSELIQQAKRGAADDGMLERFLISWPDSQGEWREVDRLPDANSKRQAWEAFDRLDRITEDAIGAEIETDVHGEQRGLAFLRFSEEAREAFSEWRTEFERVTKPLTPPVTAPRMAPCNARSVRDGASEGMPLLSAASSAAVVPGVMAVRPSACGDMEEPRAVRPVSAAASEPEPTPAPPAPPAAAPAAAPPRALASNAPPPNMPPASKATSPGDQWPPLAQES